MITIVLCDDEAEYIANAKSILRTALLEPAVCDYEYTIKEFYSSSELVDYSKANHIDILILDIHMPHPGGISVAEHFHAEFPDTAIIFLSNYEQYVFYSLRFSPHRFVRKSHMESELSEAVVSAVISVSAPENFLDISTNCFQQKIPYRRIMYIEKLKGKNYIEIYCSDDVFTCKRNISSIEKELKKFHFTKVNSGTLVNMKYIHHISRECVHLENGTVLKISGGYGGRVREVKEDFIKYMRNNKM